MLGRRISASVIQCNLQTAYEERSLEKIGEFTVAFKQRRRDILFALKL
jgi:hypothetical protein